MPLADHIPALDDRRFEDLVDEARTRIARYAPEWTDTNPGDAGFALVELFAWLSEMMIYRLGRTPELNYLKFLQLIGIELTPARPAGTVLTFPVRPAFAGLSLSVPERTPVASAEDDADGLGEGEQSGADEADRCERGRTGRLRDRGDDGSGGDAAEGRPGSCPLARWPMPGPRCCWALVPAWRWHRRWNCRWRSGPPLTAPCRRPRCAVGGRCPWQPRPPLSGNTGRAPNGCR